MKANEKFLIIHFTILEKESAAKYIPINPDFLFEEIIKDPVFAASDSKSNYYYFSSNEHYNLKINELGRKLTYGKLGKSKYRPVIEKVFDKEKQEFIEKSVLSDNRLIDTKYTNFYFVHEKYILITEYSLEISFSEVLNFFIQACLKFIGGKFKVTTRTDKNVEEIIKDSSKQFIEVNIERVITEYPDEKEVFEELQRHPNPDALAYESFDPKPTRAFRQDSIDIRIDNRTELLKSLFDNLPDSINDRASWILKNSDIL